jgi:hypothetical protein
VTGYLIHELMEKYNDTFNKRVLLTTISKSLHDELTTLAAYSKQHFNSHYADREIYTAMLEIANEHKLYDETIYTEYLKIKDLLDTFPFIETTLEVLPHASTNEGNQHYLDVLVDLFKYNRIRIDYTNYKLRLNEDESLGKPITEETIEALTQNT